MKLKHHFFTALAAIFCMQQASGADYRVAETNPECPAPNTLLTICGGPVVYMIEADIALEADDWHDAIVWSWDARSMSGITGLSEARLDHIDDCKLVDNGSKVLVTSSYGWCAMLDYDNRDLLFYSTKVPNAHSADILPGNLIAVGCSDGTGDGYNSIQLYRQECSDRIIAQYDFSKTHGVVWNSADSRLYVAGARKISVYRLDDEEADSPALILDYEVVTAKSDVHDLLLVNPGKLTVAGHEGYLYDIDQKSFRNMPLFIGRTSLKSLNLNPATGEMWYTDATDTADIREWFTHKLLWASGRNASGPGRYISIPDVNVYKVRVARWGEHE